MNLGDETEGDGVPETNKALLVLAGVLLLIPLVALMWVGSYNRTTPKLGAFPFFFWYQFAWVLVCSAMTYGAYRLVLAARGQSGKDPDDEPGVHRADDEGVGR
jgi:membrane protein implicated in regulation of membrane protease activity